MDIRLEQGNGGGLVPIQYTFDNFVSRRGEAVPESVYVYGYQPTNEHTAFVKIHHKSEALNSRNFVYLDEAETEAMILALQHALSFHRGEL